jgi:chromosome segregation protein
MRLYKIEALGFKSFKDKVSIQVPDGAIAIVGPNGCGKSNIVDAVKWALGEQNPRHLRGKSMEDMVFAGTSEFPPIGMAEVSLFFEKGREPFPEPYGNLNEMVITRRLYRSGESEYLINKSQCRLKDITDITMDTGLGQRFYGLIEQGMVESFMNYKPDEKRLVFEEVAGTAKYRVRKRATTQKLDAARLNLDRVEDIISEVEKRHQELEREAARALEYKQIFDELKKVELYKNAVNYRSLKNELDGKSGELGKYDQVIQEKELSGNSLETELEVKRNDLFFLEKEYDELKKALFGVSESLGNAEKEYYAVKEGKSFRVAKIKELQDRKNEIAQSRQKLQEEITAIEAEIKDFEKKLSESDSRLREEEKAEEALRNSIKISADAISALQGEIINHKNQQAYINSQVSYEDKLYNDTLKRIDVINDEVKNLETETAGLKDELNTFLESHTEKEKEKQDIDAYMVHSSDRLNNERKAVVELRRILQENELKKERLLGTYNSGKKFIEEYKGFSNGAQHILKNFPKSEVKGSIIEYVDVKEEMLTAFENYLKDKLELILVNDGDTAKKALDYLRREKLGSCFILPLSILKDEDEPDMADSDFISAINISGDVKNAVIRLFRKARLVKNMDEAFELFKTSAEKRNYITPDGDVLDEQGIVYGGSKGSHNPFIMEKARLKELEAELGIVEKEIGEQKGLVKNKEEQILKIETDIRSKREELAHLSIDLSTETIEIRHKEEELKRRAVKNENLNIELKNLNLNLSSYEKKKNEFADSAEKLNEAITGKEAEIVIKSGELETDKATLDNKLAELTAIKVSIAEERRNYHHRNEGYVQLKEQLLKHESAADAVGREEEALLKIDGEAEKRIGHWEGEIGRLKAEEKAVSDKARGDEEKITNLRNELREKEKFLNSLRNELERNRKASANLKDKLSDINLKVQLMIERIREKYYVDITRHYEEYAGLDVQESDWDEARIEEQWKKLREMGEVNLLSIDEFDEVKNRFDFLKKQKTDIEQSIESLNTAIDRINKVSVEMFIASIKNIEENFDKLFRRLFGGGKARIVLTQEDNILESGVDIAVELPYKRSQSIDLLSGGEKALVAIALIFGFYMQKPSPFCLLDEVDAPLDDANVIKFKELLKEMSSISQFMVVTHNKIVMETANILYGVTMETPGVSKVVSVKTHYAENQAPIV